jgi:hypothetical protein
LGAKSQKSRSRPQRMERRGRFPFQILGGGLDRIF